MNHFASDYSDTVNELLHKFLYPTWCYRHEIFEVPGFLTALLINYEGEKKDETFVNQAQEYDEFLRRMSKVKPDWAHFDRENIVGLNAKPHKMIGGWEGRTFYFIRGGSNPQFWTREQAEKDVTNLLLASASFKPSMLAYQADNLNEFIPPGREHFEAFEKYVRSCVNFLFNQHLGEPKYQVRTEPGNEGLEIRDIMAHNSSTSGVFHDLKIKYSCSEIIFDAKNKIEISRDDLRQLYCYLKPAIGLWGFIVCRDKQPEKIMAYNRTLHKNFAQNRGVIILTADDIGKMIQMKIRDHDPADYVQEQYSSFIKEV